MRLIDADELLDRIDKVAKKPSLSADTVNGLCGAVGIIYDMLIEGEKSNMRTCPSCGLEVHTDFKNCPRCGKRI